MRGKTTGTAKKLLAFVTALAVAITFIPFTLTDGAYANAASVQSESSAGGAKIHERKKFAVQEDYTLEDYKDIMRSYVDGEFAEYVGEESDYCADIWNKIMGLYTGAMDYIDKAERESDLFTTDGFFIYPSDELENAALLIEVLGGMDLHYVKDSASGIAYLRKSLQEDVDGYEMLFSMVQYNDYYQARLDDTIDDIRAALKKANSFEALFALSDEIDEKLGEALNSSGSIGDSEDFGDPLWDGEGSYKWLYTNDEVSDQRAAAANMINCYIDVQLAMSGYTGDTKAMKKEAKAFIKSLENLEIVEDIWEAGDAYIEKLIKKTGVAYEDLSSGDRLRALKALRELSFNYTQTDYSDEQWDRVEEIFDESQTIIYAATKTAEIKYIIRDTKARLAKIPDLTKELALTKAKAVKDLKKYTNKKKYKAVGVKLAKQAIKKIKAAKTLDAVYDLWDKYDAKCASYIKKFRITVKKKGPGKVSKSKMVKYGGKYTVKLQPKAGKRIKAVYIDGKKKKLKNSYTFRKVKKKHTIRVVFGT